MRQRGNTDPLVSLRRKLLENVHKVELLQQQEFISDLLGDLKEAEEQGLPYDYVKRLAELIETLQTCEENQQGETITKIQKFLDRISEYYHQQSITNNTPKLLADLEKAEELYLHEKEKLENASEDEISDEWLREADENWVESLKNFAETMQLIELGTPTAIAITNTILEKPVVILDATEIALLKIFCRDLNTDTLKKSLFSKVLCNLLEHDPEDKSRVPEYWKLAERMSLMQLYDDNNDRIAKLRDSGTRPRSFSLYSRNSDGSSGSPRKNRSRRGSLSSPRKPSSLAGSPRKASTPRSRPSTPRGDSSAESSPRKGSFSESFGNLRNSLKTSISNLSPRRLTPRDEAPLLMRLIERCKGDTKPLIEVEMDFKTRLTLDALKKPFHELNEDEFYKLQDILIGTEDNNKLLHSRYTDCQKLGSVISYIKNNDFENDADGEKIRANNSNEKSIIDLYLSCNDKLLDKSTNVSDYLKETAFSIHIWLELIKSNRDLEHTAKHGNSPRN